MSMKVGGLGQFRATSQKQTAVYHRCPKCFESLTLIQPQHKGGAFKGPAKGQCLNCMDAQEYDLTVPINKEDKK